MIRTKRNITLLTLTLSLSNLTYNSYYNNEKGICLPSILPLFKHNSPVHVRNLAQKYFVHGEIFTSTHPKKQELRVLY